MLKIFVKQFVLLLSLAISLEACSKSNTPTTQPPANNPDTTQQTFFVKGADVSWLTEMEAAGYKFYNRQGAQQDCMQILKDLGINTIRLRAWVNPLKGWCSIKDVLAKALRAKTLGLRIMLDFHYSDYWADPGKQNKPAAWASLDFTALTKALYDYTYHVMDTLKANGIVPSYVQVGNENDDGMLWEDGRASTHMANFAALVKTGYEAVKAVSDTSKVIVHISNGYKNDLFRWIFDGLQSNGAKWDVIGMSLYPQTASWQTYNAQCIANVNDMLSRYKTPVMICEVGMPVSDSLTCKQFLSDLISKMKQVNNNSAPGVCYWEPESYNWANYTLGAFDANNKPTIALEAFKK